MIWALLVGLAVVFAGLAITFAALEGSRHMATYDPKRGWQESEGLPAAQFWGEVKLPAEPINTWTNLAYYAAGWAPLGLGAENEAAAILFGLAMTWLCIGSAMFHGTLTDWGQVVADHGGMIGVFAALSIYSLAPGSVWIPALMLPAAFAGALFGGRKFHGDLDWIVAIGSLPPVVLGLGDSPALVWSAVGVLGVAFGLSKGLDRLRVLKGARWLHGAWHVMSAAGVALLFLSQG